VDSHVVNSGAEVSIERKDRSEIPRLKGAKWGWLKELALDELSPNSPLMCLSFEEFREAYNARQSMVVLNYRPSPRARTRFFPPNQRLFARAIKMNDGSGKLWLWVEECEPRY